MISASEPASYEQKLQEVKVGVRRIVAKYQNNPQMLIQMLLDLQGMFRWLPEEMIVELSRTLDVPLARIYEIVTFYKAFSLKPRGRYVLRVCTGTACQVRGASLIIAVAEELLGVKCGATTTDMLFTLETVNCVGCCPIAPVVVCGEAYHGNVRPSGVRDLLSLYK